MRRAVALEVIEGKQAFRAGRQFGRSFVLEFVNAFSLLLRRPCNIAAVT